MLYLNSTLKISLVKLAGFVSFPCSDELSADSQIVRSTHSNPFSPLLQLLLIHTR